MQDSASVQAVSLPHTASKGGAPFYGPPPVLPCHIGGKAFL